MDPDYYTILDRAEDGVVPTGGPWAQHTAFYHSELRYAEVGSWIVLNFPLPAASRRPTLSPYREF